MVKEKRKNTSMGLDRVVPVLFSLPWLDIFAELVKVTRKLWQGLADEGMYEVLEHEATLEILDKKGKRARVHKRQKVRYRQNNIIAYQDQAWGDGEILLNYRCSPGGVVDRYRPGHKTFLLISLRDSKHHGDVDEFNMEWGIRDGFLREKEFWETEVSHRTKQLWIRVIFPKDRLPQRSWLVEALRRRKNRLVEESLAKLPDGRWQLSWQANHPRLNERYQLHWEW